MKKCIFGVILMFCVIGLAWSGARSQSSGGGGAASAGEVVKPDTITWLADVLVSEEDGLKNLVDKYKELTGITLDITKPAHNQYMEKVDLTFATGEAPDVVYIPDATYMQRYAGNNALVNLNDWYVKYGLDKKFDTKIMDGTRVNNGLYIIPYTGGNGTLTYYRGDWLKELGMQPPKTYDEFIAMLRGFKQRHPEAVPYTAPGIIQSEFPTYIYTVEFFQDAVPDYTKVNGRWVDGIQQPNMRAAMERWRSAFTEGLIDRDIVTNNTSAAREKIYAQTAGVMNYWAGPWHQQFNQNLQKNNPNGVMDALPAIQGVTYFDRVALGSAISRNSKNPEGVFKYFLGGMFDEGPLQLLFTHGVEGVHYKTEGGKLIKLPSLSNPAFTNTSGTYIKPELTVAAWARDPYELPSSIMPSFNIFRATAVPAILPPLSAANERFGADILVARKKFLADVVYGNASFDAALAAYKAGVGAQVDQVLADYNK